MNSRRLLLLVAVVLALGAVWRWSRPLARSPVARAFELSVSEPGRDAAWVSRSMAASDDALSRLRSQGVTDPARHVQELLASDVVSEEEARSFFEANRAVFGGRDFVASRTSVEQLLHVHHARLALGLPRPDNGLSYP